ncbi:unnamed protein product, partial [Adineta ricciae]
MGRNSGVLS